MQLHSFSALRALRCAAVVSMCAWLGGCYTTSISQSHRVEGPPPRAAVPQGAALVAVRWPMAITEPGFSVIDEVYEDKLKPALNLGTIPYVPDAYRRMAEFSSYYALELYSYLRAYLGEDAVLLEPYVVTAGADGGLKYEPVFDNTVPVAFAVDVVEPPSWLLGGPQGDMLWTKFRISVAPSASPRTCGLVGGADWRAKGWSGMDTRPVEDEKCSAASVRHGPHYTFLDYFSPKPPKFRGDFPIADGLPLRPNAVVVWPHTLFKLPMNYLHRSAQLPFSVNVQKPDNEWVANMARVVAQAATKMDLGALTEGAWAEYASFYDAGLRPGAADAQSSAKRRAIGELAQAEKQWTIKQDEKIAQALLDGRFGKTFRQRRVVDAALRQQQHSRGMAAAMSMYGVGMNAGLGGAGPVNNMALVQGLGKNFSEQAESHRAVMEQMRDQVRFELGPEAAARDQMVQVQVTGGAKQVSADSRARLREQLRQIYRERFKEPGS